MRVKIGDVILYKDGNSWISRTIRKLTNSKYNHAGIYVGDGLILEALFKGVRITSKINPNTYEGIDIYRLKSDKNIKKSKIRGVIDNYVRVGYSKFDLVKIWLHLVTGKKLFKHRSKKCICSEVVAQIYRDLKLDLYPGQNLDYITPQDLSTNKKLKKL